MFNTFCLAVLTAVAPTEVTINVSSTADYILVVDGQHIKSGETISTYKPKIEIELWYRGENGACYRAWILTSEVGNKLNLTLTINQNPINWCKNESQTQKFHRTISNYYQSYAY